MVALGIFVAAVAIFTVLAAVIDARMHRIPNFLTVPTALLGLAYHLLTAGAWGALISLSGFAVGFSLLLLPWILGGSGMGDVKLLAALGAWLGPWWILIAFCVSGFTAMLLAMGVLVRSSTTRGVFRTGRKFVFTRQSEGRSGKKPSRRVLPFAVPVALSTWAVLAWLVTRGGL